MKRKRNIITGLLFAFAMLEMIFLSACDEPETVEPKPVESFQVYLEIDFKTGLFTSDYDVVMTLDGKTVTELKPGTFFTDICNLQEGRHELIFFERNNDTVSCSALIDVTEDRTYQYSLKGKNEKLKLHLDATYAGVEDAYVIMPDVSNYRFPDAKNKLNGVGYRNIDYVTDSGKSVVIEKNWAVLSQSISAGEKTMKDVNVVLTLSKDIEPISLDTDDTPLIKTTDREEGVKDTEESALSDNTTASEKMPEITLVPTVSPSPTPVPTATPVPTPVPTATPTPTPVPTATPTPTPTPVPATATFSQKEYRANKGDVFQLQYVVERNGYLDTAVDFEIAMKEILIYDDTADSLVALAPGATTVSILVNGTVCDTCNVIIDNPIREIKLPGETLDFTVGESVSFEYSIEPEDALNINELKLVPADEKIGVLEDGSLVAVEEGETAVYFMIGETILASQSVRFTFVPLESFSFAEETPTVEVGRTAQLRLLLVPENTSERNFTVISDNAKILQAELDDSKESVMLTGIAKGKTNVTVTASNGRKITSQFSVSEVQPEMITIQAGQNDIYPGMQGSIKTEFSPEDTTNRKLTYKSSNPKVIKVDANGNYTALNVGSATITVTAINKVFASIDLRVQPIPASSVAVTYKGKKPERMFPGDRVQLQATVYPDKATDRTVIWGSSNPRCATVDKNGVVTAVAAGDVTITASASNGVSKAFKIHIDAKPQKFKFSVSVKKVSDEGGVGNNWSQDYHLTILDEEQPLKNGAIFTCYPGDTITICWETTENDKSSPDYGYDQREIVITEEICKNGFSFNLATVVAEDQGRYAGRSAEWEGSFKITPVR